MKMQWTIGVLVCAAAFGAHAQYKYIGPDGRVVYSDQPPPPSAKILEKKLPGAQAASSGSELPFALQNAVKNFPVTLFTAPNCGNPCSEGRKLLVQRGVPYTEKTITSSADLAEFRKTVNADQLPVILVGSNKQTQFEQGAWTNALDIAGYPANNQLPPTYKNPTPVGVAPVAPPTSQTTATANGQAAPGTPATPAPAGDSGSKPEWFKGF